jgi:hypothetical protein
VKTERRLVPPCWAAFFCAAAGCNQDEIRTTTNVLKNGVVVGRIFLRCRSRRGASWMWHNGDIKCAAPWTGDDLALGLQMMLRIGNYEKLAERAEIRA